MNRLSDAYERVSSWWMQHPLLDPAWIFVMEATFEEAYAIRAALLRREFLICASDRLTPSPGKPGEGGVRVRSRSSSLSIDHADGKPSPALPGEGEKAEELLSDALVRHDVGDVDASDEELRRLEEAAFAFCERVVSHQGVQGPPEALFMGYSMRVVDGVVDCCCVADQASVASAVLDVLAEFPEHANAAKWLACIERWADWVIREFATPTGGIGVGILSHKWNPIPEYWCATSLFATSLFKLTAITGKDVYAQRGLGALEWLSRFDFENVAIPTFLECAPEVIFYASDGIVEGLRFLTATQGPAAARSHPAAAKFREMAAWLVKNLNDDGLWPEPAARGYRDYSLGVPWILLQADELFGGENDRWFDCATRCLSAIMHARGQRYYGAYVRPWATGLAWLSLGQLARRDQQVDQDPVAAALELTTSPAVSAAAAARAARQRCISSRS